MSKQAGVSLFEVLVSLMLLSLILLGANVAEMSAWRAMTVSYYMSVAIQQLQNAVERAQRVGEVSRFMVAWNIENAEVLPQGHGCIEGTYPYIAAQIYWGGATAQTCHPNTIGSKGCLKLSPRSP